jgi:tetratricopeptide (TPR) repeat protein
VVLASFYAVLRYGGARSRSAAMPSQRISITAVRSPEGAPAPFPDDRGTADGLFNEAMAAYEMGDSASVRRFIPMALSAYQRLESLDLDARFHLGLLNLAADRPQDALAQADIILAEVPDHLLGLAVAAQAYGRLGRTDQAITFFQRFLEAYTPEAASSRPEYIDHARTLPIQEEAARRYLEEHGRAPTGSSR